MSRSALALVILLSLAACGGEGGGADGAGESAAAEAPVDPIRRPRTFTDTAPPLYRARFETTAGNFVVEVHRDWAPRGADHFYHLLQAGFYDSVIVHRVVPGQLVQFGLHADPQINNIWSQRALVDDPVLQRNTRGRIAYAHAGPNSRMNQVYINLVDHPDLDSDRFAPFGEVVEGMDVVDAFYGGYGEVSPGGNGPDPYEIATKGASYLKAGFPELPQIVRATIEDATAAPVAPPSP